MPTREIPREEWPAFCDMFTRNHRGTCVTVELLGDDLGAQLQIRDRPFIGLTADLKGAAGASITIIAGGSTDDHTAHVVTNPASLKYDDNTRESIEIKSATGATTLASFRMEQRLTAGGA